MVEETKSSKETNMQSDKESSINKFKRTLFTFKKTSWHVKFWTWLFGSNPSNTYKTGCPYFWTYVVVFLLLPLILLVRMFGNAGVKILTNAKDYKETKTNKMILHLESICNDPELTPEQAYKISHSKCYKAYKYWKLTNSAVTRINELSTQHIETMSDLRELAQDARDVKLEARSQKIETYKENKYFMYIAYLISGSLGIFVLYAVVLGIGTTISLINWYEVGVGSLYVLTGAGAITILYFISYALVVHVLKPFFIKMSCMKLPNCSLCSAIKNMFSKLKYILYIFYPAYWIIKGICKLFAIIGSMIYATYKKQCPRITWED
jgi:hypothetical protein